MINEAQQLVGRISAWAAKMGVSELSSEEIERAVQEKGNKLWSKAWQVTREQIGAVIGAYDYMGAQVKIRGSVQKGFRGDPKARTRFDERDFDVDMYVVHPTEFDAAVEAGADVVRGKIFPQPRVPGLVTTSNTIVDALTAAFPHVARIARSNVVLRRQQPTG